MTGNRFANGKRHFVRLVWRFWKNPLPLFNARPNRFTLTNGKHPTSEGTPQFPNGISGKLPYHLTSNRNFRIFWPNGKHPNFLAEILFSTSVEVSRIHVSSLSVTLQFDEGKFEGDGARVLPL